MALTKEQAKKNLEKLIEKLEKEQASGKADTYNEEATKTVFIQPFLKDVLGWDVNDRDEVSPEENSSRGRVDYGLKIEGKTKIFVETKPLRADLNKHIAQAVQYGYNKKDVPFVLLTDFEELMLFDVTVKPDLRNPRKGIKIELEWKQYPLLFDKLWLLSKESAVSGDINNLLLTKPKERITVDKAILDDLERWRENLAKDIYKNNPKLFHSEDPEKDGNYLKEITQKLLDRIIFMRFCEDRKLIHRQPLNELFEGRNEAVGTNTMVFLKEEFRNYNIIFDSDLFRPEEWESNLAIDFSIMKSIILETCNPYSFDVISPEVLGNIYEQYLGYTIRLTDHQVKYELKSDVRKAGGIYYTPEYIVDYIVKNTVGKLLQELSPAKIKKIRILDPACGSGSFLIRAYEEMLNWYLNQKKQEKSTERQLDIKQEEAVIRLTIQEKAKILREHIFGVDIDEQAVGVTKLSLMLKMLEGEYGIVAGTSLLPMLGKNIKCGNSLISGDTLELKKYFGDNWYKVNPFNWEEQFRSIMVDEGGFDVVIGNPPYVVVKGGRYTGFEESKSVIDYYKQNYKCVEQQINVYVAFLELSYNVLRKNGFVGMIVPNTLLTNDYCEAIRQLFLHNTKIFCLNNEGRVFKSAVVEGLIIISKRDIVKRNEIITKFANRTNYVDQTTFLNFYKSRFLIHLTKNSISLINKCLRNTKQLSELYEVWRGLTTGDDKKFLTKKKINEKYKKVVQGKQISRYYTEEDELYVYYSVSQLDRPRQSRIFEVEEKLISKFVGKDLEFSYDNKRLYALNTTCVIFPLRQTSEKIKYILGLLNSKLLNFYFQQVFTDYRDIFPIVKSGYLEQLPIRTIDFSNSSEKKFHDELVSLVGIILELNKRIQSAKGSEKEQIQRQIEKIDKEIDEIVYKLYEITEEEKKIIEEG